MPCPTHEELLALAFEKLENEPTDDQAANHVTDCTDCRDLLSAYQNVLRGLRHAERSRALAPATVHCLDDNDLAAYADGGLTENDRERVESHLVKCATCLDDYVQLSEILAEVGDKSMSAIAFVVELARNSLRLVSHPQEGFTAAKLVPANVLGADELGKENTDRMQAWTQTVGNYSIRVSITQVDEAHADVSLAVEQDEAPLADVVIILRSEGRTVQSETLDKHGEAIIASLAIGSYECAIAPPHLTSVSFELTLVGSEND